ncbi:MAG: methyltransferase [Corynebacterium sp.]|uniref:DUF7782 domain-containing protein n=1 Tax=Corynebacterium sp. TaxID=1720 RepID=UPI0026DABAE9|nr:methyltransferase [Corynebacterium sp.]MDO5029195.1 methyltransferase [Corynebacterium sp.]
MTFAPSTFTPPTDQQLQSFVRLAEEFSSVLRRLGFSSDSLRNVLGDEGLAALNRGEPGIVDVLLSANVGANAELIALFRLLILGDYENAEALFGAELTTCLLDCGILAGSPERARVCIDVRPVEVAGVDRIIFSDRDASMSDHVPGANHVLGVGRASRSLLDISPSSAVGSVLDLGAGGGIQSLGQPDASTIVATDIHPRALLFARANFAANGYSQAEVREGSWFEPVAGEKFDRIVANPPFVVGLPSVEHVYRDSGLDLDGATELMLRGLVDHLADGGTAHLLGAWAHIDGESWQQRIASWLPAEGLEVWVTQRDIATPAEYIGTWLRDESIDPRSAEGCQRSREWLEHFRHSGVVGIGFGYITVQRIDGPTSAVCEEMPQPLASPFAPEAEEYLGRAEWLRAQTPEAILDAPFTVRPGVAIERVSLADVDRGQGFAEFDIRISRTDGPAWSHSVDESVVKILGALHPEAALSSIVDIMAMFGAFDEEQVPAIKEALVPIVVDLVRHGLIVPTELL